MQRRSFLASLSSVTATGMLLNSNAVIAGIAADRYPELAKHKIDKADLIQVNYHWPRLVGRNGTKDVHGQHQKATVLRVETDQGAMGWGLSHVDATASVQEIIGKSVAELVNPESGLARGLNVFYYDFAMFDLMGVILKKPVYELLGAKGTKQAPVYSGMIYIDEQPIKEDATRSIDTIMNNCAWDYNYGYRQLKIKIGRGKMWYSPKEGMEIDVKVYKMIHEEYKGKNVELLVDANNGYTLEDTIAFMTGIGGLPLYWMEEPFPEEVEAGRKLRAWMDKNGFARTRYADGEYIRPGQKDIAIEMVKDGIVNTYLNDIHAIGITNWLAAMPIVAKAKADASPHAWGDKLKTHYTMHLAAGLGNVSTVEGVTTFSDDIDYGTYPIRDGKITVSDEPGFGMKLLKLK